MEGTVKFFDRTKGFGFITSKEDGKDYYVNTDGLAQGVTTLNDNDQVVFEAEEADKGLKAVNVRKAGSEGAPASEEPAEEDLQAEESDE